MKHTFFLVVALAVIPVFGVAQLKQDIGLHSSWREFNVSEKQINLTFEYTIRLRKLTAGIGVGAERWYIDYPAASDQGALMKPSFTGKIEPMVGFESNLFHSPVFLSAKVGTRFYFFNQLKDSVNLFERNDDQFLLGLYSRRYIENLPVYDGPGSPSKSGKYYVTKMPVTFLTRFSLGYAFQRVKVSAFIMPYWVRFYYQNAAYPERTGKTTVFFYDIGLGVNYTLPNKKQETKQ